MMTCMTYPDEVCAYKKTKSHRGLLTADKLRLVVPRSSYTILELSARIVGYLFMACRFNRLGQLVLSWTRQLIDDQLGGD